MKVLEEAREYKKKQYSYNCWPVFPTFAPEICIKNDLVDLVCVGEGENALIQLSKN